MTAPSDKLCVCGRSATLPWCDGSHTDEDWQCEVGARWSRMALCASRRFENLATRLAARYRGAVVRAGQSITADRCVVLVDGSDLESVQGLAAGVTAPDRLIVAFGVPARALRPLFRGAAVVDVGPTHAFAAFRKACEVIDGTSLAPAQDGMLASAFVSHAVADEPVIAPATRVAADVFGARLFWCADSIPSGATWQADITAALRDHDIFVFLLSKASHGSGFCAFELGMAYAISKPIHIISLDGTLPPAFVQHIQAVDLPRLQRTRPWMDLDDLLLEQLLTAMS